MKVFAAVFIFLAFALVSEAVVEDNSIVDKYDKCTSELRVEIQGSAIAATEKQARADCRTSCRDGVAQFKSLDCQRLCGLKAREYHTMSTKPTTCHLCFPNKNTWIGNCRALVDIGANDCVKGCSTAVADWDSTYTKCRISSTSGAIKRKFPSKITN